MKQKTFVLDWHSPSVTSQKHMSQKQSLFNQRKCQSESLPSISQKTNRREFAKLLETLLDTEQ